MRNFLKLTMISVLLVTTANCACASEKISTNPFAGFYANIALGPRNTLFSQRLSTTFQPAYTPINSSIALQNFYASVHLGLGYAFPLSQRFSLSLEPFIHFNDSINATITTYPIDSTPGGTAYPGQTQNTAVQFNNVGGGLDIKPSVALSDNTSLFTLLGLDLQTVNIALQLNSLLRDTGGKLFSADTVNSIFLKGLRFGIGMMEKMDSNWAASFYYVYTSYGNKGMVTPTPAGPSSVNTAIFDSKLKLATNSYMFALQYFFNAPHNTPHLSNNRDATAFAGYYFSFALGTLNDLYKNNSVYFYRVVISTGAVNGGDNLSNTPMGTLQGQYRFSTGYGWRLFKAGYIGLDLSTNLAYRKEETELFINPEVLGGVASLSTNVTITTNKANYNAKLKLGFVTDDNMLLYLQGGLVNEYAQLQLTQTLSDFLILNQQHNTLSSHISLLGWSAGIGMQKLLPHRLALSLDYLYSDYGVLRIRNTINIPMLDSRVFSQAIVRLRDQAFMVGIVKYFS